MYRITLSATAEKELRFILRSQPATGHRIETAIELIAQNPTIGVPLRHQLKGLWKYRVGSYRVLYEIHRRKITVAIIDIGHRRDVYR